MKLVIDIPEMVYEAVQFLNKAMPKDLTFWENTVANGTPLPKNMTDNSWVLSVIRDRCELTEAEKDVLTDYADFFEADKGDKE